MLPEFSRFTTLNLWIFLGLTYSLKWNTNNMAEVGIKFEDKPVNGITTAAKLQFVPLTGYIIFKCKFINL